MKNINFQMRWDYHLLILLSICVCIFRHHFVLSKKEWGEESQDKEEIWTCFIFVALLSFSLSSFFSLSIFLSLFQYIIVSSSCHWYVYLIQKLWWLVIYHWLGSLRITLLSMDKEEWEKDERKKDTEKLVIENTRKREKKEGKKLRLHRVSEKNVMRN